MYYINFIDSGYHSESQLNRSGVACQHPLSNPPGFFKGDFMTQPYCPKRKIILNKDYALVPLTQGQFGIIDIEDIAFAKSHNWVAVKHATYYMTTTEKTHKKYYHRLIMNCPPGKQIDHINHDGLDNRKINLRITDASQNSRNTRKTFRLTTSKFKGVYWDKSRKLWAATIRINYKHKTIGRFKNEIEAAKAYDKKAKELFGEYSCLNFFYKEAGHDK